MSWSSSDNINKLLKIDNNKIGIAISGYLQSIQKIQQQPTKQRLPTPSPEFAPESVSDDSIPWASASPAYEPNTPPYIPTSPVYNPNSPQYDPTSPKFEPRSPEESPPYAPSSPTEPPPKFTPYSPDEPPPKFTPYSPDEPPPIQGIKLKNEEVKTQFDALPERDKIMLMKMVAEKNANKDKQVNEEPVVTNPISLKKPESSSSDVTSILKVPEEKKSDDDDDSSSTSEKKGGEIKSVSFSTDSDSSSSSSGETKQIKI